MKIESMENIYNEPSQEKDKAEQDEEKMMTRREVLKAGTKALAGLIGLSTLMPKPEARAISVKQKPVKQKPSAFTLESQEKVSSLEQVKQKTIDRLMVNDKLKAEIGRDNIKEIKNSLEEYDFSETRQVIARLAGMDESQLLSRPYRAGVYFSQEQWREAGLNPDLAAIYLNGIIASQPGVELKLDGGKINKHKVKQELTHEYLHHLTSGRYLPEGKGEPWIYEAGLPYNFLEGTTELLASRVEAKKDLKKEYPYYCYRLGEVLSAAIAEEAAGSQVLFKSYLEQDISELEKKIDGKFGKGSFEQIFNTDNKYIKDPFSGEKPVMDIVKELVSRYSREGKLEMLEKKLQEKGINEKIIQKNTPDIEAVFGHAGEAYVRKLEVFWMSGVVDTTIKYDEKTIPVRFRCEQQGESFDEQFEERLIEDIKLEDDEDPIPLVYKINQRSLDGCLIRENSLIEIPKETDHYADEIANVLIEKISDIKERIEKGLKKGEEG